MCIYRDTINIAHNFFLIYLTRQSNYFRNRASITYNKDLKKKTLKTDWDWKQDIGMHFCGQLFSVVPDKYLLNGPA